MIRSQLTNYVALDQKDLIEIYKEFFEQTKDMRYLVNGNAWQSIKLIIEQYKRARSEVQSCQDPNQILEWVNANKHRVFNVPFIHAHERKVTPYESIEFVDLIQRDELNQTFYFTGTPYEETISGPGYEGSIKIYIPYNAKAGTDVSIRWALASLGIYTFEMVFSSDDRGRYLDAQYMLMERDFNFTVDFNLWNIKTFKEGSDEFDDFDEMWDKMDEDERRAMGGSDTAWEIENGYRDEEDPRIDSDD